MSVCVRIEFIAVSYMIIIVYLCEIRNFEEPLLQFPSFYQSSGSPRLPLRVNLLYAIELNTMSHCTSNRMFLSQPSIYTLYLLIRQNSLVNRIPVDNSLFLVGQACLVELQEEILRPLVVLGITSSQFL